MNDITNDQPESPMGEEAESEEAAAPEMAATEEAAAPETAAVEEQRPPSEAVMLQMPSLDQLILRGGGLLMVVGALMSWVALDSDHIAGARFGAGLLVLILGLLFMLQPQQKATMLYGAALGAFGTTLIFVVNTPGTSDPSPAIGVWVSLAGASIALLGATWLFSGGAGDCSALRMARLPVFIGSAMAIAAVSGLDWILINTPSGLETNHGLDGDILIGIPILILGILANAAAQILDQTNWLKLSDGMQQGVTRLTQAAGIGIAVFAAGDIIRVVYSGTPTLGSGPVVALLGGLIVAHSVKPAS